jgi:preprotein translocase subunit SecG
MVYYLVVALYIVTCFVLVLVILLQQGKGGDIANAFGGGASQAAFGARSGATVLTRATAIGAIIFVIGAVMLSILGQRGPGSVISGRSTPPPAGATLPANPAAPTPAPATPAPATPAPAK